MIQTIGICCTGNSCRSPIMAIWLENLILQSKHNTHLWTAGVKVNENHYKEKFGTEKFAKETAKIMQLNNALLEKLEAHTIKKLNDINKQTDLIFWITELHMTSKIDDPFSETRFERMKEMAKRLGSTLIIIPEKDFAYAAKKKFEKRRDIITDHEERKMYIKLKEPEVVKNYLEQGIIMKKWSSEIFKMIS